MDLLREYTKEDKNEKNVDEKVSKVNCLVQPEQVSANLVATDEQAQVNARKNYYANLESESGDVYMLKVCNNLIKFIVPLSIILLILIFWVVGLAKYYEKI